MDDKNYYAIKEKWWQKNTIIFYCSKLVYYDPTLLICFEHYYGTQNF